MNRVAVLDESHIMSENNHDINGDASLETIFTNDYWGRPMNSPSSHKSWRPLTVLSFRWSTSSSNSPAHQLFIHRLFNIVTHAAIAELVGSLSVELVKGFLPLTAMDAASAEAFTTLLYVISKGLFALHPTHVEVTANAANRPHLLGALFAVVLSSPNISWGLFLAALAGGYLSSESFLFTIPSITVTLILIVVSQLLYQRKRKEIENRKQSTNDKNLEIEQENNFFSDVMVAVLPRTFLLVLSGFVYFGGRYAMDWLNIPEGLIRPAENPFYRLEGATRFRSYVYVLGIHMAKSWSLDFIGFSHEYGHACILPITTWGDVRFITTVIGLATLAFSLLIAMYKTYNTRPLVTALILLQLGWWVTLFPISGIIKVGTFISDRIVVASTVSTCIVLGILFTSSILPINQGPFYSATTLPKQQRSRSPMSSKVTIFLVLIVCYQWRVVHMRTMDWMGWIPLLNSALKTCPRFAKAHLELSKISNGLYKEEFNLTESRRHVEMAEEFDPNFCDVHQQYAQIAIQENKYLEFEERLSKAVTCTFTSGGAAELWQRYWKITLDPQQNSNQQQLQAAQQRYQRYMTEIQKAIDAEAKRAEEEERLQIQKKKSPFFWDQKSL